MDGGRGAMDEHFGMPIGRIHRHRASCVRPGRRHPVIGRRSIRSRYPEWPVLLIYEALSGGRSTSGASRPIPAVS